MFAVIFDFDGTIVDSESAEYESHRRFCADHGVHLSQEVWCTSVGIMRPDTHWFNWLCERAAEPPAFDRFQQLTRKYFREHLRLEPLPGIDALLGALVAAGVPRGVASSASAEWVVQALDGLGLKPSFTTIVTGDQVRLGKPAPDVYLEASRRLKIAADRCIAIEDSGPGLAAARAAGMKTIAIPHALSRGHDFSMADLTVRSAADLTLEQLNDLLEYTR